MAIKQALEDRKISKDYFSWLCSQVMAEQDIDNSQQSYTFLADRMFRVSFNDNVPNDRNRSADAIQLRQEFLSHYADNYQPREVADLFVSSANILEVLVALAKRADFEWNRGVFDWFAQFLQNLKLTAFVDSEVEPGDVARIGRVLAKFNERKYSTLGHGGLFPLRRRTWEDQRGTELWYQLSHYIEENRVSSESRGRRAGRG